MRRPSLLLLLLLPILGSCANAEAQAPTEPSAYPVVDLGYLGRGISAIEDPQRRLTCYAHTNGGIACVPWR